MERLNQYGFNCVLQIPPLTLIINTAYRNPDYPLNSWISNFEHELTDAYIEGLNITVMVDFNIDILVDSVESRGWLETIENFNLSQVIKELTRVTSSTSTLVQ